MRNHARIHPPLHTHDRDVDDPGLPIDPDNEGMLQRREATLALANELKVIVNEYVTGVHVLRSRRVVRAF